VSELRRGTTRLRHAGFSLVHLARRFVRCCGVVGTASPPVVELGPAPSLLPVQLDDRGDAVAARRLIVVCAWCGRFRVGGSWVAAVAAADLDRSSHGICPACFEALERTACDAVRG
jgi:hypothetical protein